MGLKITVYIAVDADGDFGVHTDSVEEAIEHYNDSYSHNSVLDTYQVNLDLPTPKAIELNLKVEDRIRETAQGEFMKVALPE